MAAAHYCPATWLRDLRRGPRPPGGEPARAPADVQLERPGAVSKISPARGLDQNPQARLPFCQPQQLLALTRPRRIAADWPAVAAPDGVQEPGPLARRRGSGRQFRARWFRQQVPQSRTAATGPTNLKCLTGEEYLTPERSLTQPILTRRRF